jgi:hypothetical protein
MHCTRLPFWTELRVWALEAKRVLLLRPEKAFTEVDSEVDTADEAAAKAAEATAVEAATMDAIVRASGIEGELQMLDEWVGLRRRGNK